MLISLKRMVKVRLHSHIAINEHLGLMLISLERMVKVRLHSHIAINKHLGLMLISLEHMVKVRLHSHIAINEHLGPMLISLERMVKVRLHSHIVIANFKRKISGWPIKNRPTDVHCDMPADFFKNNLKGSTDTLFFGLPVTSALGFKTTVGRPLACFLASVQWIQSTRVLCYLYIIDILPEINLIPAELLVCNMTAEPLYVLTFSSFGGSRTCATVCDRQAV